MRVHLHTPPRVVAIALGLAILALVLFVNAHAGDSHHDIEHTCHHHPCWILIPEPTLPAVLVFIWFSSVFRFTLLQEYSLLVFKPPRVRPLPIRL